MDLLSSRLLTKNAIFNVVGQGLPMLVGLFCIPVLIERLGLERFGVLSLVWMIIGYFNLFDLGLGRATIKLVAEKLGENQSENVSGVIWTSAIVIFVASLVGAIFVFLVTPWMLGEVFHIKEHLLDDSRRAFYYLALGIPIVAISTCFRGGLEAKQRFGILSLIQIFLGMFAFGVPAIVIQFSDSVASISIALVIGRVLVFFLLLAASSRCFPGILREFQFDRQLIGRLMKFGGWMTVSNTISPMMVYFDRFLIGALVPISNLAFYTTPYEIVSRLHVVPSSIVRVLFPAFSNVQLRAPQRLVSIFDTGNRVIFLIFFPLVLVLVAFSQELLTLWLGPEFSASSHRVLEIIAIGFFINALAQIPFSFIQSLERADLTAKLHLVEFPIYFVAVWYLTSNFGLVGAALAWTLRVTLDAWALALVCKKLVPSVSASLRKIEWSVVISVSLYFVILNTDNLWTRLFSAALFMGFFVLFSWIYLVELNERVLLLNFRQPNRRLNDKISAKDVDTKEFEKSIVAVYHSHYPSERLVHSVRRIATQVESVIIVDSASSGLSRSILEKISKMEKVQIIFNSEYLGAALAFNRGIKIASDLGAKWILTLDQDSYPADFFVDQLIGEFIEKSEQDQVFAIYPTLINEATGTEIDARNYQAFAPMLNKQGPLASLFRVRDFFNIGAFDEGLFREYICLEHHFRVIRSGFKIVESTKARLTISPKAYLEEQFQAWEIASIEFAREGRYYGSRNRFILYFRYGLMDPRWVWLDFQLFCKAVLNTLTKEEKKLQKVLDIASGVCHSLSGKMGRNT